MGHVRKVWPPAHILIFGAWNAAEDPVDGEADLIVPRPPPSPDVPQESIPFSVTYGN